MNAPSCAPPELARSIEHARTPADPKLERARTDRLDQHESPGGRSGCLGVASSREARGCSRAGLLARVAAMPLISAAERACGARGTGGTRSEDRWRRARGRTGTGPSTLGRGVPVEPALRTFEVDDQRPRASPEVPGPGGGRGRGGGLGRPRHAELPYACRHLGGESARALALSKSPPAHPTMRRRDRAGIQHVRI